MLIKCNFQDTDRLACVIFKLNQHCVFLFVKPGGPIQDTHFTVEETRIPSQING